MTAAEGVTTVDSTELDFDQTVEAVIGVIRSCSAGHWLNRAAAAS